MASEQVVLTLGLFAIGFLWYSNELNKRGAYLWGQAFQIFCFLMMISTFTIGAELLRSDGLYDSENLLTNGLMVLITWIMWAITFTWIASLVLNVLESLRNRELDRADSIGGNRFGPK